MVPTRSSLWLVPPRATVVSHTSRSPGAQRVRRLRSVGIIRAAAQLWSAVPTVSGGVAAAQAVVRYPRRRVETRFAVLLLRSSYEVADELDFIAMDKFQARNWNRRASEQEPYLRDVQPLRPVQGDVGDPLYFDFIVFVQLLVIGELMQKGEQVFTELIGAEGEQRTVRRAAQYADNALLPEAYARLVGDRIFTRLRDGFEEQSFGGPQACTVPGDWPCALAGVQSILECFQQNGFAFSLQITDTDEEARRLRIHVEGAATLFALAALAYRQSRPPPTFLEYTLLSFLRASGWNASASARLSRTGYDVEVQLASI